MAPYAPPDELRQFAGILRDWATELGGIADIAEDAADKREEWKTDSTGTGGLVQPEVIPPSGPVQMGSEDSNLEAAARYVYNTYGRGGATP